LDEVAEFDHRQALEVVTLTDYTDKRDASYEGRLVVTY
jgi:hypothetical protein